MLPHIKPLIVRKLHSGKMSLDLKLTPSTWSAVPLPLVSSDTAAGGSMILLPFKRSEFSFELIDSKRWAFGVQDLGPSIGKCCTKPSYVMCSQCLIRSGFCVLKELVLCSLGFKLVENSRFKKEKRGNR